MSDALAHASEGGHSVQSAAAHDEEIGASIGCLPDERFDRGPFVDGRVCGDRANRIELELRAAASSNGAHAGPERGRELVSRFLDPRPLR